MGATTARGDDDESNDREIGDDEHSRDDDESNGEGYSRDDEQPDDEETDDELELLRPRTVKDGRYRGSR